MSSNLDPYKLAGATLVASGGNLLDRYTVEGFVGLGRVSAVYRGTETESLRPVALRVLNARATLLSSQRAAVLQRLRDLTGPVQEVANACPTFAEVADVGAFVGEGDHWMPVIVQPLVAGERRSTICRTLEIALAEERARRPPARTLTSTIDWMTPLADALTYGHACGMVHGNVTPQSVVVRRETPLQLMDLGLARVLATLQAKDRAFAAADEPSPFFFDPGYAPPEHFAAARRPDALGALGPASDVFSLALVMLELLTGLAPLGPGDDARLEAVALDPVARPTPRSRGRDLGGYVDAVFERALAVRPADRHGTVESFWSALRAASRLTLRPSRPAIPPPIPLPSQIPTLAEAFLARSPRRSAPAASELSSPPRSEASDERAPESDAAPFRMRPRAPSIPSGASAKSGGGGRPRPEDEGANELGVGETIAGKYAIEGLLGRGGMGTVWRCMHVGLGERVAVKVMSRKMADNREVRVRFEREARAAAKIKSRYVARVYDTGALPDGRPYIVMEYMEGETLADAMKGGESLPLADAVRILGQVGRGLARAHELGIVHRDVKPENVFLAHTSDDGVIAKVFDFGIVKVPDAMNDGSTRVGVLVGTPHYMSPEQADGLTIDERSDIFSLGVLAYRMFTGKRLFSGDTIMQILMRICTAPLPSLLDQAPSVPPPVDDWFQRTCARKREDRFDSVIECVEALALAAGVEVSRDVSILPPPPSPRGAVASESAEVPAAELSCPTLIDEEDPRAVASGAAHDPFDSIPHLAGFGAGGPPVEPSSVPPTSLDASRGAPAPSSAGRPRRRRFGRALTLLGFVAAAAVCGAALSQGFNQTPNDGEMNTVAGAAMEGTTPVVSPPPPAVPDPPAPSTAATGIASALVAPTPDAGLAATPLAPHGVQALPPAPTLRAGRTRRAAAQPAR